MSDPMRAVWSLWSKPIESGLSAWAPASFHHLLSWVLSFETSRRFFARTSLVADSRGAALLVDGVGLAFDEVSTALDALEGHDPAFWALGKLYAYRDQPGPFLHIDSDVFFWQAPPADWLGSAVCAAYPEFMSFGSQFYRGASLKSLVWSVGGWVPEEFDGIAAHAGMVRGENCAVVGGQRADFLRFYAKRAIAFVEHPENQRAWRRRYGLSHDMLIFEQHMLSACLDHFGRGEGPYSGVTVRYLFDDWESALRDAGERGFTHLIGGAKRDPNLLSRLEARVAADYPAHYDRCRSLAA